jgi:hypothetical protein
MPPPNQPIFTASEIEKMRLFVTEHDKQTSPNVFDLNNPPRVNYVHREWPRLLYKLHGEGHQVHLRVHDEAQLDEALAAGWSLTPVAAVDDEFDELDPATQAEVDAVDKVARQKKKKK